MNSYGIWKMTWTELKAVIDRNDSFLISSHLSMDGDSIGSQLAMYWYLKSLSKRVSIYNHDTLPSRFSFLHNSSAISYTKPKDSFDVLVILDCSNPDRLGWSGHDSISRFMVNIDHHRDNTHFADINIVDKDVAATAQLIYLFFESLAVDYPREVAEYLYIAIMTDTGGFRFSNTTSAVLRICSHLAEKGLNCSEMYQRAYDSHTRSGMMLWSRIWSSLEFFLDDRICALKLPLSLIDELGASYSDSEGIADRTVLAQGVEVGMFIKYKDTETHFSLRSRGDVDVGKIAQKIPGGGGHGSAAGCTIYMPYEEAIAYMLDIIRKELDSH
ncbi:MAG: hypothetical protein GF401_18695 [Chitinivibrionales bacterium]|nr:hypothetical protein [Chitinivibrionales bacterium]